MISSSFSREKILLLYLPVVLQFAGREMGKDSYRRIAFERLPGKGKKAFGISFYQVIYQERIIYQPQMKYEKNT